MEKEPNQPEEQSEGEKEGGEKAPVEPCEAPAESEDKGPQA